MALLTEQPRRSEAPPRPAEAAPPVAAGRGHRLAMAASRAQGAPLIAFWLLIVGILVLPIALFLLVAFSPRLLAQGPQW
ncbi:MAG TPA: hypothetical protein VFP61_15380, partial [Acidimicrobiales bacterium]|nr:hypothetical protein [Acidimicrobiales bacterium]